MHLKLRKSAKFCFEAIDMRHENPSKNSKTARVLRSVDRAYRLKLRLQTFIRRKTILTTVYKMLKLKYKNIEYNF